MAGPIEDDDDGIIDGINMVPFIDICLVLLIIFMVTSSYIVRQAIQVDLPAAASGTDVVPSTIAISVFEDGRVELNGRGVEIDELRRELRAEVDANAEVQAIIAGDRRVDYGAVIDVVDAVKLEGVRTFALNIERRTDER